MTIFKSIRLFFRTVQWVTKPMPIHENEALYGFGTSRLRHERAAYFIWKRRLWGFQWVG